MDQAKRLLSGKVKKVVLSAESADAPTFIMGVNNCQYDPKHKVISMASDTANCLAPLIKVIHEKFGIRAALMTTIHAVTFCQKLLDGASTKSWRDGRAAFSNIVPATTDAIETVTKIIPSLQGKITGIAFWVPIPTVSVIDLTCRICTKAKMDEINDEIRDAADSNLNGIMCYTEEKVVSSDFIGCSCSTVYDASSSVQLNSKTFKFIAWFDNEFGYASRLADFVAFIAKKDSDQEEKNKKDCEELKRKINEMKKKEKEEGKKKKCDDKIKEEFKQ